MVPGQEQEGHRAGVQEQGVRRHSRVLRKGRQDAAGEEGRQPAGSHVEEAAGDFRRGQRGDQEVLGAAFERCWQ